MKKVIETERLILREFMDKDALSFYQLNEDEEVIKYTGDSAFTSLAEAEIFIREYDEYRKEGFGRWAVMEKREDRFLGWCGLKRNEENHIDLGFRFYREEWGKGYATESARACVEYGFGEIGISCIVGRAIKENVASIRVLQKVGMEYWKEGSCQGMEGAVYYKIEKPTLIKEK